jgi:hypothetical protein
MELFSGKFIKVNFDNPMVFKWDTLVFSGSFEVCFRIWFSVLVV